MFAYISSWALFSGKKGLSLYDFDPASGNLSFISEESDLSCDVSYYDSSRNILYVCHAVSDRLGIAGGGGEIVAFSVNKSTGKLEYLFSKPSYGANPCNLSMNKTNDYMVVVNHTSAASATKVRKDSEGKYYISTEKDDPTIVLFPVKENGELDDPTDIVVMSSTTSSYISSRPHSVTWNPTKDFFAVCDNGADMVCMYTIDYEHGCLKLVSGPYYDIPFSTVRYCLFHPELPYFYTNHEWGSLNVRCYLVDGQGILSDIETISSVPDDYIKKPHDEGQGFLLHPNGKYIYNFICGPQEIAVFEIDQSSGKLSRIQNVNTGGDWLRCGAISPDGKYLISGCMKSGEIKVYSVSEDGTLSDTGIKADQPGAAWITLI